jgi:hypothetical protein
LIAVIGVTGFLVIESICGARIGHEEVKCEGKVPVLLRPVKPLANLRVVILIIPRPTRHLDLGYMGVFSPIC